MKAIRVHRFGGPEVLELDDAPDVVPSAGTVVVKIEAGRIKHWREYQYRTDLDWEKFTRHNRF